MEEEPNIEMNEEEAKIDLEDYMVKRGVDQVMILQVRDIVGFWEFHLLKPYGVFLVHKVTGEILDNYGVFQKKEEEEFGG